MEDSPIERICMCALNKIFGYKPAIALALIENLGSAEAVFKLRHDELETVLGPFSPHLSQIGTEALDWAEAELDKIAKLGGRFIYCTEDCFPALLKECPDAPVGLYIRSSSRADEVFACERPISIIGTRDISPYGSEWCKRIVRAIASCDSKPTIVSGLAIGTDICAHISALEHGLSTIAVMATGIDCIYPWRHNSYAEQIAATPGCALISDYPTGTSPLAPNFLRRNRIIAGLSGATILIESKIRGGGIMTANLACSYGRDTYALPGRVDDVHSQGCNYLIRSKVAEPITDCSSLLEGLGLKGSGDLTERFDKESVVKRLDSLGVRSDMLEKTAGVLLAIKNKRGITMDELSRLPDLDFREISAIVSRLERDGLVSVDLIGRCSINVR